MSRFGKCYYDKFLNAECCSIKCLNDVSWHPLNTANWVFHLWVNFTNILHQFFVQRFSCI
jgi:hypothetical protein